jgi:hypothetical protein
MAITARESRFRHDAQNIYSPPETPELAKACRSSSKRNPTGHFIPHLGDSRTGKVAFAKRNMGFWEAK